MNFPRFIFTLLCILFLSAHVSATEPHLVTSAQPQENAVISQVIDKEAMLSAMKESQVKGVKYQLEALSDAESTQLIAKFSRGLYESLIKEGFTEDQALQIVIGVGLPTRRY